MDERWVSDQNSARYISNMYSTSDGAWRSAGGVRDAFTSPGPAPVVGLHHFRQGGLQWTLVERENTSGVAKPYKYVDLSYIDQRTDTLVDIENGRMRPEGPWRGSTFMESGRWVYTLNGHDTPIRWDGRDKSPAGFQQAPPAPQVSVAPENLMGNNDTAPGLGEFAERWTYGWAISLVNDVGAISPPSAIAYLSAQNDATVSPGPNPVIRKRNALIETQRFPDHVRGVILWRTANVQGVSTVGQQGAALYFVRAFPTGGKIHYVDGAADEQLLEQAPTDELGLFPVGATLAHMFKGTMFTDSGDVAPTRLRYSSPQNIEQFPDINYIEIGDKASGCITGLLSTKNALVVFKERGIYLVRGNPNAGYRADALTEDVGHMAGQNALKEIPGIGVVFWAEPGPYVLIGALENTGTPTEWRFIGSGIAKTWRHRVNTKALPSIRAEVNLVDRELWVLLPEGSDDQPSLGLAYHYESGGWSVREGYNAQCIAYTRCHRARILLGTKDGEVKRYTHAEDPPALSEYRSSWLDLGGERTQVRHVKLHGLTLGADVGFGWRVDHHPVGFQDGPDDRLQGDDYERNLPEWGSAVWGVDPWYEEYPTGLRFDLYLCNGFTLQWRATGNRLALTAADITFVPSATHTKERNV